MPKIAVHLHLYYLEQLDDILCRLSYLNGCDCDLFVTMSELNPQASKKILKFNPKAILMQTPNLGYDVGPFIDFLHKIKLDNYDYILKIHTKRMDEKCYSLFNGKWFNSKTWREMLLDSVLFSSTAVRKNLDLMKNDKVIGMIGNFYTLTDEKIYLPSREKIKKEMSKIGLSIPSDLHFVAGTMFLVRAQLLKPFLVYNIKDFAKTDKRFRDNTLAHICERLFCFAITAQGYKIQGVKYRHYWQETTIAAVKRFLFQKKITRHGNLIIKICKIPVYIKGDKIMKGILLAGGSGTRLYPLTKTTSKQLLPVYDKPMIYYPLSTLMLFGIKEVLIISTPKDTPNIEELFGDGSKLGMKIHYAIQNEPKGIAQAFTIGADFIGNDDVCLILGDNIFYMGKQFHDFKAAVKENAGKQAVIFAYHVADPERFGVVEFDKNHQAVSIEEKPEHPKSNYASVGLYFYPSDVVEKAKSLKPSARGELEITDLNNMYLQEGRMSVVPMQRGNAWLDAGTPKSLMDASNFVQIIEDRQGLKIACIEEIAYRRGFINAEQMKALIDELKDSAYKKYLTKVYEEYHELY